MNEPQLRSKTWTEDRTRYTLKVHGGLHYIRGNSAPYFSLTADLRGSDGTDSGGAMHQEILRHFPELADLARLHLSEIDGVPIHAEANGWYDLAGALPNGAGERYHAGNSERNMPKAPDAPRRGPWDTTDSRNPTSEECLEIFAHRVRVDLATARELQDRITAEWERTRTLYEDSAEWTRESWTGARAAFGQWIRDQFPRWQREAEDCITAHKLELYGDEWKPGAA